MEIADAKLLAQFDSSQFKLQILTISTFPQYMKHKIFDNMMEIKEKKKPMGRGILHQLY